MDKVKAVKKETSKIQHRNKRKSYRNVVSSLNERTRTYEKPITIAKVSSKSKRFKSLDSHPAFSIEIIESVFGVDAESKNGIIFKCPPKGQPAFKIKD
ncbi:MAG: hypothetical protein NC299_14820 [Lachnospiraceae bacterium]|nr:hypothetical protein [Ruminococcus sp.]MCM1276610.1 hypothetical protein [Lachnospiraceae bacterium]